MATTEDYLALSDAAYGPPKNDGGNAPQGWTKVDQSDTEHGHEGSSHGYYAVAYQNDESGEIVIANRGSRPSLDGLKEDWGGTDVTIARQDKDNIPEAFHESEDFARRVVAEHPGKKITTTGHSLGGAHAQMQAAAFGLNSVTFGAPGVRFAVSDAAADAASDNVVNYVLPGDFVGASGDHIGRTVPVFPSEQGAVTTAKAVTAAAAIGGLLGGPLGAMLAAALAVVGTTHPLGNYASALDGFSGVAVCSPGGGRPAARISDMHVCPMVTGIIPHVGGPISGPCAPTVLIGGMPAARVTDLGTCVGPPDTVLMGSGTVLISKLPAARVGDMTLHGGSIIVGMPTVLVGG